MKPLRSALLYAVLGLLVTAAHTQPIVRLLGAPVGYWGVMLAYWALASALGGHVHYRWGQAADPVRWRFGLEYALALLASDLLFRITRTVFQGGWVGWGLGGFVGALALGRLLGLIFRRAPDTWAAAFRLGLWGGAGSLLAWAIGEGPGAWDLAMPWQLHEYGMRPLAAVAAGAVLGWGIGRLYGPRR